VASCGKTSYRLLLPLIPSAASPMFMRTSAISEASLVDELELHRTLHSAISTTWTAEIFMNRNRWTQIDTCAISCRSMVSIQVPFWIITSFRPRVAFFVLGGCWTRRGWSTWRSHRLWSGQGPVLCWVWLFRSRQFYPWAYRLRNRRSWTCLIFFIFVEASLIIIDNPKSNGIMSNEAQLAVVEH